MCQSRIAEDVLAFHLKMIILPESRDEFKCCIVRNEMQAYAVQHCKRDTHSPEPLDYNVICVIVALVQRVFLPVFNVNVLNTTH